MTDSPFSQEALRKTVESLPSESGGIGVVVKPHDIGISGSVKTDVGRPGGWTLAATGEWFKQSGYKAAAWLGWTGKT